MKTCPFCLGEFKNLGAHMRKHSASEQVREAENVQETRVQKTDEEEARPKRPLERFGNQRVFHSGQYGVRVIRRGN